MISIGTEDMKKHLKTMYLIVVFALFLIGGCKQQGSVKNQGIVESDCETNFHAFLLGGETAYCIDLPSNWWINFSDTRNLGFYWEDEREGYVCSFSVEKVKYDLGRKIQVREEYDTLFYFVNGMVGLRQSYKQKGEWTQYGKDGKQYRIEKIFTDDMNECINVHMEEEQYERNRDGMEEVIHASYFQKDTIGTSCDESLESRELVCVHTNNIMFALEVMVPKGIMFYEGEYGWFMEDALEDYQLIFYLDESQEEYVRVYSDSQGYFYENEKLLRGQVQYDYSWITESGLRVRQFQFEEEGEEYFWFPYQKVIACINSGNEVTRDVAGKIVESIRFE